jgi:hypothetical protein
VVDELMLPLPEWCRSHGISTVYSRQGDTTDVDSRERGYVLFRSLGDLDRFFTALLPIARTGDPNLADQIADSYRGPDWRARRARAWTYEVRSTAGSLEGQALRLWPTVRFPGADLKHLNSLLARVTGHEEPVDA